MAGLPISGPFTYCLDGVQGDADFIAAIFALKRDWDSQTKATFSTNFVIYNLWVQNIEHTCAGLPIRCIELHVFWTISGKVKD